MSSDELVVPHVSGWAAWLAREGAASDGVWLVLAKRGAQEPTSLTYDQALEEALCRGWIDGQKKSRDAMTFLQRFTPRRTRSVWSARNVQIVERLTDERRMTPAGLAEVERARADGRWDAAYAGQATIEVPDDLAAALRANPRAQAMFDILTRANRYAVCWRVVTAKRPETRERRISEWVGKLADGQTPHPQKRQLPG